MIKHRPVRWALGLTLVCILLGLLTGWQVAWAIGQLSFGAAWVLAFWYAARSVFGRRQ
jgi:hypothetical protein